MPDSNPLAYLMSDRHANQKNVSRKKKVNRANDAPAGGWWVGNQREQSEQSQESAISAPSRPSLGLDMAGGESALISWTGYAGRGIERTDAGVTPLAVTRRAKELVP